MTIYIRNRHCPCVRCRTMGLIGPAILITLGLLILLDQYWIVPFGKSCPVLLIVVGLLLFAARSGSIEGHVEPKWMPRTYRGPEAGGISGTQSSVSSQEGGEPRR